MFSSLRRQAQSTLFRQAARIYTSPNLYPSLPASAIRFAIQKPGAVTTVIPNAAQHVTTSARLFSIYSRKNAGAQAALEEEPEVTPVEQKAATSELVKFQDLVDRQLIDKQVMKAIIEDMKFQDMTEVQSKTIKATLAGHDVLAQAKTGTGKTIAFLLPVLQRILTARRPLERHRPGAPLDIRSIIISPTRELAQQIAKEAEILTKHCSNIQIHTAVGGTGKPMALKQMHRLGCHILIATPGRLYDLLTDSGSGVHGKNLEMLVLDEADNLLDQGFAEAVFDIIKLLPPKDKRQTMLFSATVPEKVQKMINAALRPEHKILKMVPKGEVLTHNKIEQRLITVMGFENLLPTLYEQMQKEIAHAEESASKPFKAIVFFPTAKFASLAAQTFNGLRDPETGRNPFGSTSMIEIHSRLTQNARERAAKKFREGKSAVLFSSDVVARGMDFPDVTHVFQVGSPRSLEQYIHRIGRTGRGNNTGLGYILLADFEKAAALKDLRTIKLQNYNQHSDIANVDMSKESVLPKAAAQALTRLMEASNTLDPTIKKGAYTANIGYYASLGDKVGLIASLNRWATLGWGMSTPPRLSAMLAGKLGLKGIPGIEISRDEGPMIRGGGRGGFGGFSPRSDQDGGAGFTPREGGFPPRGDREGGFKPREGGFAPREGGFAPREGGFAPRGDREGGFKPREGFAPREGGFTPRGDREGGFKPREGGFVPRGDREGGFTPRGDREGGFKPREGGFAPRGDREGGFTPRGDREGGFKPREGFAPRGDREGGFTPRGDREGGFKPREGFAPRGDREGGFKPREGGFIPRGDREGGFKPREGFAPRGDREDGFKPRQFSPREDRPARPWESRGRQTPGRRFN